MDSAEILMREILENENDYLLPNFQRNFVWKKDQQKELLASFLVGLPIHSFLFLNSHKNPFPVKELGYRNPTIKKGDPPFHYILDGQQRLSTLKFAFKDVFNNENWKDTARLAYKRLKVRWFISLEPKHSLDIFGVEKLVPLDLTNYLPDEIFPFLEFEKVLIGDKGDKWWQPGFLFSDEQDYPEQEIIKEAVYNKRIPLYLILDDALNFKRIVDRLANQRVEELKALVETENEDLEKVLDEDDKYDLHFSLEEFKEEYDEDSQKTNNRWEDIAGKWAESIKTSFTKLLDQKIHVLILDQEELERAVSVFEKINQGGTELSDYDLIVAKASADPDDDFKNLNDRIVKSWLIEDIDIPTELLQPLAGEDVDSWEPEIMDPVDTNIDAPENVVRKTFLKMLGIFADCKDDYQKITGDHLRATKYLNLSANEINEFAEQTINAIKRGMAFLQFRCGIIKIKNLQYEQMLIPVSYLCSFDRVWKDYNSLNKLECWYWASIFSGAWRENQTEKCQKDTSRLGSWILDGGDNQFKDLFADILDAPRYSDKEILLYKEGEEYQDTPKTALKTAILQYILSEQPYDWIPEPKIRLRAWEIAKGKDVEELGIKIEKVENHHIIPLANVTKIGDSTKELRNSDEVPLNSVLNRTYISHLANNKINSKSLEQYQRDLDELSLSDHLLPDEIPSIEDVNERPNEFLEKRYEKIKTKIKTELDRFGFNV